MKFGASFFENTLALGQNLKGVAPTYSEDLWIQGKRFRESRRSACSCDFSRGGGRNDGSW